MSQAPLQIPTTGTLPGPTLVADTNALAAALATGLSGPTAPSAAALGLTSLAGISYYNTTTAIGYRRDLADTVWMPVFQVDETTKSLVWLSGGVPLYGASVQATGTGDALVAAFHPAPAALVDGGLYPVRSAAANATTTPTLAVNGLAAVTITKQGGAALAVGDISGPGDELLLRYNASANHMELVDAAGTSGAVTNTGISTAGHVPKYADGTGKVLADGYAVAGTGATALLPADAPASATKAIRGAVVALTSSGGSIAVDFNLGNNFSHALTENTVLGNPSNVVGGQSGCVAFTQNPAAPYVLAFGSFWIEASGGTAPTVSATLGAQNLLSYYAADATHIYYVLNKHGVA